MREITIGEKEVRVKASVLALLFYKQEFKSDLIGGVMKMKDIQEDPSTIDSVTVLQMAWAMAKADNPKSFPSFEKWASDIDSFDFTEVMTAVFEEATEGFFRGSGGAFTPEK